jgi:elongator complex protein 3
VHKLNRIDYDASEGREIFLSFEREDLLLGYLRLRYPSEKAHRLELNDGKTLIVREVRVVGEIVPTNSDPERITQVQHRGFGKMLMDEAEKISSEEFDALKLNVISGIGAREWFYDLGYKVEGPYVSKKLK